jgi:hypothetical protein
MARGSLSIASAFAVITGALAYAGYHPEYGYGGTCVPGYDEGCEHPNEPQTVKTTTEIFETSQEPTDEPEPDTFVPTVVPSTSEGNIPQSITTTAAEDAVAPSTSHHCQLSIPQACVFPFHYKGLTYNTCTGVDSVNTLWCSTTRYFHGHWRQCVDPCKNKWPVHAIVSGVVASGVAATGIGLIAAAVANKNKETGELGNPFGNLMASREGSPFGLNEPPVPQATNAPVVPTAPPTTPVPVVLKPAAPGSPGVEVVTKVKSIPAPRRLLQEYGQPLFRAWNDMVPRRLAVPNCQATLTPAQIAAGTICVDVPVGVLVASPTTVIFTTTLGNGAASGRLFWYLVIGGLICLCCACICGIAAAFLGGFGKKKGKTAPRGYDDQAGYPGSYDQGGYDARGYADQQALVEGERPYV